MVRRRTAFTALFLSVLVGLITASPALDKQRGLSIDLLTALRWRVFGDRHNPQSSPTTVIAFDEESYRTSPFKGTPTITWTRELGRVLTAVVDGGAKVIGFDVVFPTSIETSEIPFGQETIGARLRGFDRDFLRVIASAARDGKLVLGEIQNTGEPIRPAAGQRIAVGQQSNIRALNVFSDDDDVVRRVPLMLNVGGKDVPAMALELAARVRGVLSTTEADGSVAMAGYRIPAYAPNAMALNFEGGSGDIPTYSLADLRACVEKGDADFFRRNFGGKVVLVGSSLEFEDRKITSKRFATSPRVAAAERCVLPASESSTFSSTAIDGVYIHATAVNNLLRREALTEVGRAITALGSIGSSIVAAFAALVLTPAFAILSLLVLALTWTAAATIVFNSGIVIPFLEPVSAAALAMIATTAFRLFVTDKDQRFLRKTFALYLSPAIIEKMVSSNKLPSLGGETRNVTIFFSDIAAFSSMSAAMKPKDIVALMNTYLSEMTDIIEEHGGYVDKYVGDAIVAVFGAPVELENHARQGVLAALRCCERLAELNQAAVGENGREIAHRIGLNSGLALIGNIGSRRRFNYTVMGDAVNLASRIEGANKYFGTSVLASESTVRETSAEFAWREIGTVRVQGRDEPVTIYQPLARIGYELPEQSVAARSYSRGLDCWRNGELSRAAEHFASAAKYDRPSALFLEHVKRMELNPDHSDGDSVIALEGK